MHYCTRSLVRTAFVERIRGSRFVHRVHHHFDDGPADQLLRADILLSTVTPDTHIYVCGPNGFMNHVLAAAERAGWPQEQVHREYFATTGNPTSANVGFEVRLAKSGRIIMVPADSSIVQALAANGIDVSVSCEAGVCGTCLTRVLDGQPGPAGSDPLIIAAMNPGWQFVLLPMLPAVLFLSLSHRLFLKLDVEGE